MSLRFMAICAVALFCREVGATDIRFRSLAVHVDPGPQPLAAYQVEVTVESGESAIVGVEGGEHSAFAKAPFYDPAALKGGRIILAAFSTQDDLPVGRTRVASLHVRESGDPATYSVRVVTAGSVRGRPIEATANIIPEGDEK